MKKSINEAMIFAAGFGKRMLPITDKIPKPLVKINDKSLLLHQIEKLLELKFKNIVVNAFHLADRIVKEVKPFNPKVRVIVENEILETGGGLLNAIDNDFFLRSNKPKVLINGDIFWIDKDYLTLDSLIHNWSEKKMDILLCLKPKNDFFGYYGNGDFDLKNSKSKVSKILKINNCSDYTFTGLQIINPKVLHKFKKKKFSIREIFFSLIDKGRIYGFIDNNPWYHISNPRDLNKINLLLK